VLISTDTDAAKFFPTKQISPALLKKLQGRRGPIGPKVRPGPQGPEGKPGPAGFSALSPLPPGHTEVGNYDRAYRAPPPA
jgi:hypothetical protein